MSPEHVFKQQRELLEELNGIVSEGQNPDTLDIDLLSSTEILTKINNEDHKVAGASGRRGPVVFQRRLSGSQRATCGRRRSCCHGRDGLSCCRRAVAASQP